VIYKHLLLLMLHNSEAFHTCDRKT